MHVVIYHCNVTPGALMTPGQGGWSALKNTHELNAVASLGSREVPLVHSAVSVKELMPAHTPVRLWTLIPPLWGWGLGSQQDHRMLIQEAIDSTGTKPTTSNLLPNQEHSPSSKAKEENRQTYVDRLI